MFTGLGASALVAIGLFYVVVMLATGFRLNYIWTTGMFKTKMVLILDDEAKAKKNRLPNLTGLYDTANHAGTAIVNANIQNIMYYYDFGLYYRGTSGNVNTVFPTPKGDEALILMLKDKYGVVG